MDRTQKVSVGQNTDGSRNVSRSRSKKTFQSKPASVAASEKEPPILVYDISEKCLLGCILKNLSLLRELDFEDDLLYRPSNRWILTALRDIWNHVEVDNRLAYDWNTILKPYFKDHPDLAEMGGLDELLAIYNTGYETSATDTQGWFYHIKLLREARSIRQLYFSSLELEKLARDRPEDYAVQCRLVVEILTDSIERADSIPAWLKPIPAANLDRTKPPIVIDGLLYQGQKMMVTAGSKSMKSWVLLTLAYCIANGLGYLGFPTRSHKVLYLDFELQSWETGTRLDMIQEALGVGNQDNIKIINLRGHASEFPHYLAIVKRLIKRGGYSVVIMDPMYKMLMEADENSNSNVARMLDDFTVLCEECDAALIYAHHHSKGNQADKDARDRSSGAGAWMRDPDAGLDLTPHEIEDHFTLEMTPRSFKKPKSFVVRWDFPLLRMDDDTTTLDPKKLKRARSLNAQKWTDFEMIEVLRPYDGQWSRNQWRLACIEKLGMSTSTAKERISRLITIKAVSVSKLDNNDEGDPVLLIKS
jgi:hypothetical protein